MFSMADESQYEAIIERSRFIAGATAVSRADDTPAGAVVADQNGESAGVDVGDARLALEQDHLPRLPRAHR